jgi:hypothetical protein
MLLFETFEVFLSFRKVLFRTNHFLRLVIENDEVSVLEIESIELIACLFGVVHVFVDNKCGPLGVVRDTLTYLSNRPKLAEKVEQLLCSHVVVEVLDK